MSKMRETLIETPAGPVLFQDFRPPRKNPVPGYHFGEGFVGQFCRCAAGSLLGRYPKDDMWEQRAQGAPPRYKYGFDWGKEVSASWKQYDDILGEAYTGYGNLNEAEKAKAEAEAQDRWERL
jgi:hypothetical protein